MFAFRSYLVLSRNVFIRNRARNSGGAAYIGENSTVLLTSYNQFSHNAAAGSLGGAIYCSRSSIHVTGNILFRSNMVTSNFVTSKGGSIALYFCHLSTSGTVIFTKNTAAEGGGVYLYSSTAVLGGETSFLHNVAKIGGGMSIIGSVVNGSVSFIGNLANGDGGGLYIALFPSVLEIVASFVKNRAECGGAVSVSGRNDRIMFVDTSMTETLGSALCVSDSNVTFAGTTQIAHNVGSAGAGINARNSHLNFLKDTTFFNNSALAGGAISSIHGTITFQDAARFHHNKAEKEGGAVYAVGTSLKFNAAIVFEANSALMGGAVYVNVATVTILGYSTLTACDNSAAEYGGVFYNVDTPNSLQCNYSRGVSEESLLIPDCFLEVYNAHIYATNNTAVMGGSFLYGGLLNKCKQVAIYYDFLVHIKASSNTTEKAVLSQAYELCCCNSLDISCIRNCSREVYRGQSFSVALLALAQGGTAISTIVTAVTLHSTLHVFQSTQTLSEGCSDLNYNLYSAEAQDQLILYPDGPCRDSGLARVTVNVTFLPCPGGFTLLGERCSCEERLRTFDVECTVEEGIQIMKGNNSNFWMGMVPTENGSYGGLILYESCPAEYCKTQAVSLTLEDLDAQCDLNRSGVLCGQCASNYSLMLGSSRCDLCSNHSLALLLAFATAGLALVAFLTLLKLTVATGTLNSLILYANVLQANRRLFLPLNRVNILTVFIAWLNLDLGIQTCFYDGLTAYAQTWLQFVFPVYVWVLISTIILSAHHSVLLSRVIGSDPIAVLATLLLMSYTKILRVIIEVYSSIDLDYPGEERVRVWLKDGNVPYLSSGHLVLTVVTSVVLVLFFLPYTLLLLLGHRLYPFTGRKHFHWFSRIKPLLESYYAPYKPRTRYWTGFLLLVRCALYIIFSFNSLGGTRTSLLAISLTFTALTILGSGRLYKSTLVNAVEMFVYFNLVVMSTATLAGYKWPALVYSLMGTVLAIMVCAVGYQFHCQYIAKTAVWQRFKAKLSPFSQHSSHPAQPEAPLPNPSHDPHKIVSKSVVDLREPLLDI